ncbi:MAG: type 1 glutamine amidotransferase domain-containing protein [Acidobacteriaceae bacterium]
MADKSSLQGMKIACLAMNGFEWAELSDPKKAFEELGAKVDVISDGEGRDAGEIYGMNHHDKAGTVKVDKSFADARANDYDAVLLPGGALNADAIRAVHQAQQFVKDADKSGMPIAVICHAPWLLVSAGLVKGRTLTSWPTIQDDVKNAGGNWVDKEVNVDKNWVSSRKPADIPAFNREAIALFEQWRQSGSKAA